MLATKHSSIKNIPEFWSVYLPYEKKLAVWAHQGIPPTPYYKYWTHTHRFPRTVVSKACRQRPRPEWGGQRLFTGWTIWDS